MRSPVVASRNLTHTEKRSSAGFIRTGFKDHFNRLLEDPGDTEGEREAGVVLPGFNSVDRLARYMKPLSKFCLRPVTLCSKNSEAVPHSC